MKMGGALAANNPPQVMPQGVLLNQSAQNLPQQAVGAIQNNPPPPIPQGPIQHPLSVSGNPGPSGRSAQNNPLPVIAPVVLHLHSSGVAMAKKGAPMGNNAPQFIPGVPLNIPGTPAPANYAAQVFPPAPQQHDVRQHAPSQHAPSLSDIRQISECFSILYI